MATTAQDVLGVTKIEPLATKVKPLGLSTVGLLDGGGKMSYSNPTLTPDLNLSGQDPVAQAPEVTPTTTDEQAPQAEVAAPKTISPLVSDQLTGLLSQDNPYMQMAKTQGLQTANQRGLLNSSLAAGEVEKARIQAALPIAQQEAQFAANKALQNDQLAINIMNSSMTSESKNKALEFLLGVDSVLKAPDTTFSPESYKDTRDKFGDFTQYIIDSDARSAWKTQQPGESKTNVVNKLGITLDPFDSSFKSNQQMLKRFGDLYGTWENAVRAVQGWLGPNATDRETKQLIKQSLR